MFRNIFSDKVFIVKMEVEEEENILTLEKVLNTFRRISQINTPEINSKLAIVYNKPPVKDRHAFKESYATHKEELRKISGAGGKDAYSKEKEKRLSVPFEWPFTMEVEGNEYKCLFNVIVVALSNMRLIG